MKAVVKNVGIFVAGMVLGVATTLGCQKAYKKLKPKGLRDEDLEKLVEETVNL